MLRGSLLVAYGNIVFTHNKAESGGALKILDRSVVCSNTLLIFCEFLIINLYLIHSLPLLYLQVDFSEAVEVTFSYNEARFTGGAIYADAASTTITADLYNHTLAGGVVGFCFIQFPNRLIIAEVREGAGGRAYVGSTGSH